MYGSGSDVARQALRPDCGRRAVLRAPFDHYAPQALIDHFRRRPPRCVPVCEPDQTSAAFVADVLRNRFTLNGETHTFDRGGVRWKENPSTDIEWLILLHKGYYLVGLGKRYRQTGDTRLLDKWVELTDSWIERVEPGYIAADVTGRRIQNWVYAFHYFVGSRRPVAIPASFVRRFLSSVDEQVGYLADNLTSARNHRTLELHAIFMAAVFFPELQRASVWLADSIGALADNAATDILPDGVHCELSTFYHHTVLKNLLLVKRLALRTGIEMPARFDAAVRRALVFSLHVHKPDGTIPALSDGDSASFQELLALGCRIYGNDALRFVRSGGRAGTPPRDRSKSFSSSGYHIVRSAWRDEREPYRDARYLIFDCGPLGAGNHGHLDLLNIELAAYGRSLVVDPGRYTYDESGPVNWRVRFRRTRAHNTVEVDGMDQADYRYCPRRAKFRIVGPHPQPEPCRVFSQDGCDLLRGVVRSPRYSAVHERTLFFADGRYWLVADALNDGQCRDYVLRFQLAPEAEGQTTVHRQDSVVIVESPNLLLFHPFADTSRVEIEPGFVSATYGIKRSAPVVAIHRRASSTVFESVLYPFKHERPDITVRSLDPDIGCEAEDTPALALALDIRSDEEPPVQDLFFASYDGRGRRWRYRDINCSGRFCFVRLDARGRVRRCFAGPDSRIDVGARSWVGRGAGA